MSIIYLGEEAEEIPFETEWLKKHVRRKAGI